MTSGWFGCLLMAALWLCQLTAGQEMCDEGFTVRPQDVLAVSGQMTEMECQHESPEAVSWERDGTSVIQGANSPCDCEVLDSGSLQFHSASVDDVGLYTCFVLVGQGVTETCSASLRLAESPVITDLMGSGFAASPDHTLSALVTGDPAPNVQWRHNAQPVNLSGRIAVSSEAEGEGQRQSLTISSVEAADRGTYNLRATNTGGSMEAEWRLSVNFVDMDDIVEEQMGNSVKLKCTGKYFRQNGEPEGEQVQVRWLLGAEVVPASIAEVEFKADLQHNEFERQLVLDETNCGGSSVVTCKAEYTGGSRERQISVSVCPPTGCNPPAVVSATVKNCSAVNVVLSGQPGTYEVEYQPENQPENSQLWKSVMATIPSSSVLSLTLSDLEGGTTYNIRTTCPSTSVTSAIATVVTQTVVTGVSTELAPTGSNSVSARITWQVSSNAGIQGYVIQRTTSSGSSDSMELIGQSSGRYDWPITCDNVTYTFRVAAIIVCDDQRNGPFSAPVQQRCSAVSPPERVKFNNLAQGSPFLSFETSLVVGFFLDRQDLLSSFNINVAEFDTKLDTHRILNYTLDAEDYSKGQLCINELTPKAQYEICLYAIYSDTGRPEVACQHTETSDGNPNPELSCRPPTSIKVVDPENSGTSPPIPDWGIAVVVVGALLMVALLFCFLGLCFACQTSRSKEANFGSTSSLNTERGHVVPTHMHMQNPNSRAMSPTRSCLKYNRDRGHSTTWNDHVDTLRQMETDNGTHV